ncbi:hypothetical protein EJ04DRAFT_576300 [Polyplosphaeria fusca]|uniref:PNPLA domain-containing protein n=1 Tax=Polyplosphaeria fusca TaxID=682080 RepID=A0A9P4R1Q8_9PLEO|nr:hypothetical protein EJ04DRAFT_576300 [Polyplosphaeria fusca]
MAMTSSSVAGVCQDQRCDNRNDPSRELYFCADCRSCLCDKCWNLLPTHAPQVSPQHEKLAYLEYLQCNRLKNILDPPRTEVALEKLHSKDTNTTWFGIERYPDGRPFLQDFDTFSQLMANCPDADRVKYPQLVSFIGETSAGKSTLIKMLIDYEESKYDPKAESTFPAPVPGSPLHDSTPTSADVHLYSDPATWGKERPILYADCEGLNAGERIPIGAHSRRQQRMDNSRRLGLRARPLDWATSDQTRTRQHAVTQLYPRLLYTFSDVVVFVLDNPKTFENAVLPKLFEWASASLEASTNQGTLPHAIIALNFTDTRINPDLWNVRDATRALLEANEHLLNPVHGTSNIMKLADKWRRKKRRIRNIEDLLCCYYASFQVVRLPEAKDLPRLSKQVSCLHTTILETCNNAYLNKKNARLLSSGEDLGFYIQQAFTHFSRNLNQPFDFKDYSLRRNPIPQNLGGHILRVALVIQEQFPDEAGAWIFDKLSFMVASCFLYDCVTYRKGQPQDLFGDYLPNFEDALTDFCNTHWPCEFKNNKGRCVNVSKSHQKGHQNARGKVIAAGGYESRFTTDRYRIVWMNALKQRLHDAQEELKRFEESGPEFTDPLQPIRTLHRNNIARFFFDVGGASQFNSHSTCLCCLMRPAEQALRCGHVLCSECVKSFGEVKKTTIVMRQCPLHPEDTAWARPWRIRMKPDFAGVRILALDGGGIRGIAELEVLSQIQRKLGVRIPITAFFDLIVGTSTGGIIALALGVKQWKVGACIEEFKRLCDTAFTPREFHGIPGFQYLATVHHGSTWKTSPLYEALHESLGDKFLFGGEQDSDNAARVAVTTTNEVATKGIVLANYCRKDRKGGTPYDFLRPNEPEAEMRLWEAGAATAAAAPFFKPFVHPTTNETYLDGAFHNNNPAKVGNLERQLLWADVQDSHPDILLSIGTSQYRKEVEKKLREEKLATQRKKTTGSQDATKLKASKKFRHFAGILQVGKAAFNKLGDAINCERQWQEFLDATAHGGAHREDMRRYIRVNPDIGRPPPQLDAKDEVERLQLDVFRSLSEPEMQLELEDIVFRLVASCFYFDRTHATRDRSRGTATVTGKLQCRFELSSELLKQLGHFFKKHQRADFQPYFDYWDGIEQHSRNEISLDSTCIDRMASHGDLNINDIEITVSTTGRKADIRLYFYLSSGNIQGYSVSGFPRDFLTETDRAERDVEENEEEANLTRVRTHRAIPAVDRALSGKGTALLRPGIVSASEQNLSTQPHLINEADRRKSDEAVSREALGRASQRTASLKSKLSTFSLRREAKSEAEIRPRSMELPRQTPRVVTPTESDNRHQPSPDPPLQHRRVASTNSRPERLPSRSIPTLHISDTSQDRRSHISTYPPTTSTSTSTSTVPHPPQRPQSTYTTLSPTTSPRPQSDSTSSPSGLSSRAAPSCEYESYYSPTSYTAPGPPILSQPRTEPNTPTFDDILGTPAQRSRSQPQSQSQGRFSFHRLSGSSQRMEQSPPPVPPAPAAAATAAAEMGGDDKFELEVEFARQISMAELESDPEEVALRRALEESLKEAYGMWA